MAASICDGCGLLDLYDGAGDGIGSCDCPRCEERGEAAGSAWCRGCPRDGYEPDGDDYTLWLGAVIIIGHCKLLAGGLDECISGWRKFMPEVLLYREAEFSR
jgi:hypothetical protein